MNEHSNPIRWGSFTELWKNSDFTRIPKLKYITKLKPRVEYSLFMNESPWVGYNPGIAFKMIIFHPRSIHDVKATEMGKFL